MKRTRRPALIWMIAGFLLIIAGSILMSVAALPGLVLIVVGVIILFILSMIYAPFSL